MCVWKDENFCDYSKREKNIFYVCSKISSFSFENIELLYSIFFYQKKGIESFVGFYFTQNDPNYFDCGSKEFFFCVRRIKSLSRFFVFNLLFIKVLCKSVSSINVQMDQLFLLLRWPGFNLRSVLELWISAVKWFSALIFTNQN